MPDNENEIINENDEQNPSDQTDDTTPTEDDDTTPSEGDEGGDDEGDEPTDPQNEGSGTTYDDPVVTKPFIKFQLSDGLIYTSNLELTLFIAEDSYFKRMDDGLYIGDQTEYKPKYILLTEEPSDWATNYKDYYMSDGEGGYKHIPESDPAPTFEQDKYYKANEEEETKRSVTEIAQEVWQGKWGNGDERKKRLEEAGWNYDAVQAEVNRLGRVSNNDDTTNPETSTNTNNTQSNDDPDEPTCYIQKIDPAKNGGLYLVKLPQDTQFYAIDGNDNVTENGKMPKGQGGNMFTITEEKTIGNYIYAHGKSGWWIYKGKSDEADKTNADSVTPAALQGFDNWTVVPWDTPDTCVTNPEVIQMIYSFDTYRVIARDTNSVSTHTDFVKNKADVLIELNWLYHSTVDIMPGTESDPVTFRLDGHYVSIGDIIIFVTNKSHRPTAFDLNDESIYEYLIQHQESCEKLRRNPDSDATVNALYYVEDVIYGDDGLEVVDIKMRCLWTDGKIGKVGKLLQNF